MRHRGAWREQVLAEGARPRLGDFSRDGRQLTAGPAFSQVPPCRLASANGAVGAPSTLLGDEWPLTEVPGQLTRTGTGAPGPEAPCATHRDMPELPMAAGDAPSWLCPRVRQVGASPSSSRP